MPTISRTLRGSRRVVALVGGFALAVTAAGSAAAAPEGVAAPLVEVDRADALAGRYIVVLKGTPQEPSSPPLASPAVQRARALGVHVDAEYFHALRGYAAALTADQLAAVRGDEDV